MRRAPRYPISPGRTAGSRRTRARNIKRLPTPTITSSIHRFIIQVHSVGTKVNDSGIFPSIYPGGRR
ncbi:hypothetical protein DLD82_08665 [Methanospirillum stamsii]|uniref:Uncharacterized protein n=1 Tax=Methanospirillum stamsii TaxID=1277351 RepID=A0A2V2N7K9_9EURY|nr:hypothetical protein DLD82_08665 [Methanospirillum stamsii]